MTRYGWTLAAILGTGALLRLALVTAVPTRPISDFQEYLHSAQSLARTGRYEAAPGVPNGNHPPAYPLLLSLAFRVAPGADELFLAKIVNVGLALLAALLGARLASRSWGAGAGLWTAAWVSFFPRSLLMTDLIASENLFAPLLFLFLLLCAISWSGGRRLALAAAIGAVVGALALTRSVALVLPVAWLAGALAARRPWRTWASEALVLVSVVILVMLPWGIRNARSLGRFTLTNAVGGMGLFIGNNPRATGEWYPWAEDLERLRPGVHARGQLAVDDAAREEAWRWIRANPGQALRLYARKLRLILADDSIVASFAIFAEEPPVVPESHWLRGHETAVRLGLRVSGLLLAICALGGWILLAKEARGGSVAARALAAGLGAAALVIPFASAAIAVNGRYRWPAEDAVMPLAGLLLAAGIHATRASRTRG